MGMGILPKLGCERDLSDKPIGLGVISTRYAMYVEDRVVKILNFIWRSMKPSMLGVLRICSRSIKDGIDKEEEIEEEEDIDSQPNVFVKKNSTPVVTEEGSP
ncbi:unnamed protein product [Fraxinus pennsylvanica]|uniref:Uncharacterized protein n=1 Tax=Fraxinus pennsylvanica TaxID=56036 RepID=A0AAD1Z7F6_9LAMI|nr:unnamed protein product [Fraxinus pennsylvanica]